MLISFTIFIIHHAFSTSENLFTRTAIFEKLPGTILLNITEKFEMKFQHVGVDLLSNVTAIADIIPVLHLKLILIHRQSMYIKIPSQEFQSLLQ